MIETIGPLIDAHLHLLDRRFAGQIDAIIKRAGNCGIKRLFCNGTTEQDWSGVLAISIKHPVVIPFIGLHPWHCHHVSDNWQDRLEAIIKEHHCGIGEIGLDRPCGPSLANQLQAFLGQLKLAVTYKRPVVIHCVKYWGKCLDILEDFSSPTFPVPLMIHSFSGSMESMERLVRMGGYLSYSAKLGEEEQQRLQAIFRETPVEHILLESDAPDQLPSTNTSNGNLNEPSFIVELYRLAAHLREMPLDEFTQQLWQNGTIFTNQTIVGRREV